MAGGEQGANLDQMSLEQLQDLVRQDPASADQVAARFAALTEQFEARNDILTASIGKIESRDRSDDDRIEELIELRDKINDSFDVLQEDEEYREGNAPSTVVITGDILKAANRAQNYLAECTEQFYERDKDTIEVEHEQVRYLIRLVDQTLGSAHVEYLAAYLGLEE